MIKNILNLEKVTILKKESQKSINAGFWGGCQPQIIQCERDRDCPCGPCGFTVDGINSPIEITGICAF